MIVIRTRMVGFHIEAAGTHLHLDRQQTLQDKKLSRRTSGLLRDEVI